MNWTLILGLILGCEILVDLGRICYKTGRKDTVDELNDEIEEKRKSINKLTELQNNIKHNFPELDLETITLEELIEKTSDKDYKDTYQKAYNHAYSNAIYDIAKDYNKMKGWLLWDF